MLLKWTFLGVISRNLSNKAAGYFSDKLTLRPHYTKEYYEEFMKKFTKLLTHLSFFIYSSVYIVEEHVKNLWRVFNRLFFNILHNVQEIQISLNLSEIMKNFKQ